MKTKKWNAAKAKRKLDILWSKLIKQRDQTCRVCQRPDGVTNAHHINSRTHLATRWDPRNGVLLCFWHHQMAHHDIPWGSATCRGLVGEPLFSELFALAHQIKPFDRVVYEVTLVELNRLLKETK